MRIEIKSWLSGAVIHQIEADTLAKAVELLVVSAANLRVADLSGADLGRANLRGANLRVADLRAADLSGANLRRANLRVADLSGADLSGADLRGADLRGADLGDADLSGADLRAANLGDADLSAADLRGANLGAANLRGANLLRANLRGADLRGADNFRLPTGETWIEYLTETVPALLMAGGKPLDSFAEAWQCHEWTNCPMAHAFGVHTLSAVPLPLRPRAEQFVQLFDAGLIPWPLPAKDRQ